MLNGFLIIDKPQGISSNQVLGRLKKLLPRNLKMGYLGTLDPEATGVLAVALGEATKVIEYIAEGVKTYEFAVRFGMESDTLDLAGEITTYDEDYPSVTEITQVLPEFLGKSMQIPPDFSARKVNGVRAYKLARSGQEVKLEAKETEVFMLKFMGQTGEDFNFEVTSKTGFYVRSLARDMAQKLGKHALCSKIRRLQSGSFRLENAILLEKLAELLHNDCESIKEVLKPLDFCLDDIPAIAFLEVQAKRIKNGGAVFIPDKKENISLLRVYEANQLIAMAKLEMGQLCPKKVFNY